MGPTLSAQDSNQQDHAGRPARRRACGRSSSTCTCSRALPAAARRRSSATRPSCTPAARPRSRWPPCCDQIAGWLADAPRPGAAALPGGPPGQRGGLRRGRRGGRAEARRRAVPARAGGGASCAPLPLDLTRAAVRRAGRPGDRGERLRDRVALAGGGVRLVEDARGGAARAATRTSRAAGRTSRGPSTTAKLIRYFEDSTRLTAGASTAGAATRDDGITVDDRGRDGALRRRPVRPRPGRARRPALRGAGLELGARASRARRAAARRSTRGAGTRCAARGGCGWRAGCPTGAGGCRRGWCAHAGAAAVPPRRGPVRRCRGRATRRRRCGWRWSAWAPAARGCAAGAERELAARAVSANWSTFAG